MPTINKGKKVNNYIRHGDNLTVHKIYNTAKWQKLRNSYLMFHPLCEMCLKDGKTVAAEEIHHIKPISTGKDELEMKDLAYNGNNLIALCKDCHHKVHKKP